jgi:hypothetical protein
MSDFNNDVISFSSSSAMIPNIGHAATASGSILPYDPRDMMAPEPLYEARVAKQDEPAQELSENEVVTMKLMDYDPNTELIDADKLTEDQRILKSLGIQAEARLALFMNACREFRAEPEATPASITALVNALVDVLFDGRVPLDTTQRHHFTMKLVLRAALADKLRPGQTPAERLTL